MFDASVTGFGEIQSQTCPRSDQYYLVIFILYSIIYSILLTYIYIYLFTLNFKVFIFLKYLHMYSQWQCISSYLFIDIYFIF
jgi:hypothetical protein